MSATISLDDASTLLGLARATVYGLCMNRERAGYNVLKPVYGYRSGPGAHRILIGVEAQSIIEYMAWRATRPERRRETYRLSRLAKRRACPRCELITDTGGLCQMCQAEQDGRPYYAARPIPTAESSWLAPCIAELP